MLCGRQNGISDVLQIIEVCKKLKWDAKVIIGNYVISMLRGYYWVKERGFGNNSASEPLCFLWKGKVPSKVPKTRMYSDVGSATALKTISKMSIVQEHELSMVEKKEHDEMIKVLLSNQVALVAQEPKDEPKDDNSQVFIGKPKRKYTQRGRGLLRTPSKSEVPLFPFDAHWTVAKELYHEAGGTVSGGAQWTHPPVCIVLALRDNPKCPMRSEWRGTAG